MKRIGLLLAGLCAAILTVGCAPGVVIQNNAPFPVRAILVVGGQSQVLSSSAGGSSYAEVGSGSYQATVIPDAEWIEYARGTRQYLNDQLANSEALTGEQLLDVIRRLSDIAVAMDRFERAARSSAVGAASCSGKVSSESNGSVTVTASEDGRVFIECR